MKQPIPLFGRKYPLVLILLSLQSLCLWLHPAHGQYADAVLADDPVAYWRMDDSDGTQVTDSSGNGNHGAVDGDSGSITFGQGGLLSAEPEGRSISLAGLDRIVMPGFEKVGATGFSAEYWVRVTQYPEACCDSLVSDGEAAGDFFMMNYLLGPGQGDNGAIRPHFGTGNAPVALSTAEPNVLALNQVYHVVTTWDAADPDNNNGKIFINGVVVLEGNVSGNVPAPGDTGDNMIFIGRDNRENRPSNFDIDEVALYDKPLTSAQVQAHYAAGTAQRANYADEVLVDEPVAYWRLGGEGPSASDSSGNGHTAEPDIDLFSFGADSLIPPDGDTALELMGDRLVTEPFEKFETGFTVEFVMKSDTRPGGFTNLVGDGESGGSFNLMVYLTPAGQLRPHIQTDAGVFAADSVQNVADGRLHHIVSTWDKASGAHALFIDGAIAEVNAVAGAVPFLGEPANTGNPIFLGRDGREGGHTFVLDEVAIYNKPLSAERVAAHAATIDFPPPPSDEPLADPGDLDDLPNGLAHYTDFNEAAGKKDGFTLDFAYDRAGSADGSFEGSAGRASGLIGTGAATFDNTVGAGVNVGMEGFETSSGIAVEAVIVSNWSGAGGDYDEIFRKEDGGNRILFGFQNDPFSDGANPPVTANIPVLSFGLNVGGYGELDLPLDGTVDGVTLESLTDGAPHHVVANYDSVTGEKSIWVDGVKAWSVALPAGTLVVSGGGAPAYIGNTNGGGEPFTGTIDEFAFWTRALSAEEIADHAAAVALNRNYFQGGGVADNYAAEITLDNPIAYWRLGDSGPSDAVDSSGNGHDGASEDGTLEFGQASLVPPDTDTSVSLNGDRVFVDGFDKVDTGFSVEFWTKIDAPTASFVNLVGDGDGGLNFMLMVYLTPGGNVRPHVQTTDGFGSLDSVATITDGQLHHVVSTWDEASGEMVLHIDGEVADVAVSAGIFPTTGEAINNENPVFIGRDNREGGWDGQIDEVALYDYALPTARVKAHFDRVDRGNVVVNQPHPDPGNLADPPSGLLHYVDLDEAAGEVEGRTLNFAYDRVGDIEGIFQGATMRVPGLAGLGAASFNNSGGIGINLGADGFDTSTGITVEMLFQSEWSGGDYDEFFRKEDGGNRILLSYQADGFNSGANPPVDEGIPVLSFGLNVDGTYGELDMPLDGTNDAGLNVEDIADGKTHHIAATYDSVTGEKTIWIDGIKAWSVNLGEGAQITSGGSAPAFIGSTNGGEPFTGIIDDFAFWERALSAEEIAIHAANGLAGTSILEPGGATIGFAVSDFLFNVESKTISIKWNSTPRTTYALEFSADLKNWQEVQDGIDSDGAESSIEVDLSGLLQDATEIYLRLMKL
ncbi:MAG: LamG domain-containing protein [Verrucomicrobiae bacterium]|nr:LamG domain-containing protein [Verrucomicrobiae bacterium]